MVVAGNTYIRYIFVLYSLFTYKSLFFVYVIYYEINMHDWFIVVLYYRYVCYFPHAIIVLQFFVLGLTSVYIK